MSQLKEARFQPVLFGFRACRRDAFRLCRGILPGGGRIIQCLTENRNELSDECADYMGLYKEKREGLLACNEEALRLCPDIVPGGGRSLACLIGKKEKLSPVCRKALNAAQEELDGGW